MRRGDPATLEQFKLGDFDRVFSDVVIDGLDKYQDMASQVLNNEIPASQLAPRGLFFLCRDMESQSRLGLDGH
jgi:hypothetical protein